MGEKVYKRMNIRVRVFLPHGMKLGCVGGIKMFVRGSTAVDVTPQLQGARAYFCNKGRGRAKN